MKKRKEYLYCIEYLVINHKEGITDEWRYSLVTPKKIETLEEIMTIESHLSRIQQVSINEIEIVSCLYAELNLKRVKNGKRKTN